MDDGCDQLKFVKNSSTNSPARLKFIERFTEAEEQCRKSYEYANEQGYIPNRPALSELFVPVGN